MAKEFENLKLVYQWAGISGSHFRKIKEVYEKNGGQDLAPQPPQRRTIRKPYKAGVRAEDTASGSSATNFQPDIDLRFPATERRAPSACNLSFD